MVSRLDGLCRAVATRLALSGAAVTLMPAAGTHSVAASSSDAARHVEELHLGTGEGPTLEAFDLRRPVLVSHLESTGLARWPGYTPAALSAGVQAAFAFPLHVGAALFGVMTLYSDEPRMLATDDLNTALLFADLAIEMLVDRAADIPTDDLAPELDAALDTHGHVYQAQGMVMVDLGITLAEALARMRAHAFVTGKVLTVVATGIVDGEIVLSKEPS